MKLLGLNIKRLNRSSYILTIFVSMFIFVGIGLFFSMIFNAILGPIDPTMPDSPHPLGLIPFMVLWFVYFGFCTVRRFHDQNLSGWLTIPVFIPCVGLIFGILLVFIKGSDGSNKYGQPLVGFRIMGFGGRSGSTHQHNQ
jgi:uncharacterized membrane protein YhaH (DUF805 family)